MRPRLASLALVLLAVCSEFVVASDEASEEIVTTEQAEKRIAEFKQKLQKSGSYVSLASAVGIVLLNETIGDEQTRKRMNNGIVCLFEQNQTILHDSIKQLVYGDKALDKWDRKFELKYAMMMNVNCSQEVPEPEKLRPEWICSCNQSRIAAFCAPLKYKNQIVEEGFERGTCRDEAFASLQQAGTKEFGKYVQARLKKEHDDFAPTDSVARITNNSAVERANLFCDSIDATVWEALKAYYETDLFGEIRGESAMEKQIAKVCDKSKVFKESKMGECLCNKADSFAVRGYCEIRAMANVFVDKGFLDCGTKSFDNAKKPDDKDSALCIAITGSKCDKNNHGSGGRFWAQPEETTTTSATQPTLLLAAALVVLLLQG